MGTTIGLPGEEIVPSEQAIEQMADAQKKEQQQVPMLQQVQQGVMKGVELGVQSITKELTAGEIAARAQVPEGPPAHIGTVPAGGAQPATNNPNMDLGNPNRDAARGQGGKQGPLVGGGMAPNSANVVGNQPGRNAHPISPGVG